VTAPGRKFLFAKGERTPNSQRDDDGIIILPAFEISQLFAFQSVASAAKNWTGRGRGLPDPPEAIDRRCRKSTFEDCDADEMPVARRQIAALFAIALLAMGLSGCAGINEKLAAGVSDAIPAWAGGMPADAPPRPGTAKYDELMRERERKRLMPAAERGDETKPPADSLEAVH